MAEFLMPSLGADMDEGTLLEWLVKPGDEVHKGDIVAVVDTAKAAVEVECFASGVISALLVEPGQCVPVGTPLAVIAPVGPPAATAAPPPAVPPTTAPPTTAPPQTPALPATPSPPAKRPKQTARRRVATAKRPRPPATFRAPTAEQAAPPPPAQHAVPPPPAEQPASSPAAGPAAPPPPAVLSPLVRQLARQRGVEIGQLHGTGAGGVVTRADVEAAAVQGPRLRVSPLARRMAAELGANLAAIKGTGPGGAVRADDVRRAAHPAARAEPQRPAAQPGAAGAKHPGEETETAQRQAAMRRAIANLMARSKREIPHYYLSTTIDLDRMIRWLRQRNRDLPVPSRIVPAALLLKAAALAAREVPALNGFWIDDHFVQSAHVHLGVAISLRGGGMVAPAIHDADTLAVGDLMASLRDLVTRAREGRLRGSEMTDGTITVTNLGDRGVESVFGVIYPPQVALAGFGKVVSAPFAVDGLIGVRPQVTATLSADHRATDGYTGARYLEAVARLLQKPEEL